MFRMARTKQTARRTIGRKAPIKSLAAKAARKAPAKKQRRRFKPGSK
jgi:hypothetical protein